MNLNRLNFKKEENWGFISLAAGIISIPLIFLFPVSIIVSFIGLVIGLIYMLNNRGFGWDEEKKLALFGTIVNVLSIIINIALVSFKLLMKKYW